MIWNVENPILPVARISPQSTNPVTERAFITKLRFVASVLTDRRPDVVALQEIGGANNGDKALVDALQDRLGCQHPHQAVSMLPDAPQIRVAFLPKRQLLNIEHFCAFPQGSLESKHTISDTPRTHMGFGALSVIVEPANEVNFELIFRLALKKPQVELSVTKPNEEPGGCRDLLG